MLTESEYYFSSTLFEIERGEDLESNPGIYGKRLSEWLSRKFSERGFDGADAYPDDWGWRVDCQRSPITLFVGCAAFVSTASYDDAKSVPDPEDVLWFVFPAVSVPLRERLRKRVDVESAFADFCSELEQILSGEPAIQLVDLPDRGEWELPPPGDVWEELTQEPRKPLPAWLSIPLGLLATLGLPLMGIAIVAVLADPPSGREIAVISSSLILIVPAIWLARLAGLLLLVRVSPLASLNTPATLRVIAGAMLLPPLVTLSSGLHLQYPVGFAVQLALHAFAAALLWRRAAVKSRSRQDAGADADDRP